MRQVLLNVKGITESYVGLDVLKGSVGEPILAVENGKIRGMVVYEKDVMFDKYHSYRLKTGTNSYSSIEHGKIFPKIEDLLKLYIEEGYEFYAGVKLKETL
jgi:hypothetical protein